ncbi:MAG: autoinducer binding domain-containing protein [Tatlockia sp.]|nr:autoinducer binding domain-containing protein [Tatlockia sp.]
MSKNNYLPIVTDTTKQTFFDYIDALDIPQIDYFAIGIQNLATKKSISLMSLPEWQKHFIENRYADSDPVRKATLYTNRSIIPFCEIDFIDNFGKHIMQQRASMGIKNGIILVERLPKYNYMITLGTDFFNFNSFDFINRYHDRIALIKKDLINLVETDAKKFLAITELNQSIHLSSGAK